MAKISIKRGSEGPRHDPYAYTEITFTFTDPRRAPVTLHEGLGDWLKRAKALARLSDGESAAERFEALTGLSARRASEIPERLLARSLRRLPRDERSAILECIEADEALLRWAQ